MIIICLVCEKTVFLQLIAIEKLQNIIDIMLCDECKYALQTVNDNIQTFKL